MLLLREDDPGELADDLEVLVARDLPGGEPAIGVTEEVGLPGPRLAGIVGGQAGEQ